LIITLRGLQNDQIGCVKTLSVRCFCESRGSICYRTLCYTGRLNVRRETIQSFSGIWGSFYETSSTQKSFLNLQRRQKTYLRHVLDFTELMGSEIQLQGKVNGCLGNTESPLKPRRRLLRGRFCLENKLIKMQMVNCS